MNTATTISTISTSPAGDASHTSSIHEPQLADLTSWRQAPANAPLPSCKIADLGEGRELVRMRATAPAFERDVLPLRAKVYGRPAAACRDAFDEDGEHYVSYQHGVPMYAVRVTRASESPIECEECYPAELIERFRDCLVSCGRFVRNPDVPGGAARASDFLAACWADLIARGVRIEISNATDRLLPYYRTFGYTTLRVPTFRHPVWHTESYTICFIADPTLPGSVNARLPAVVDPAPSSILDFSYDNLDGAVAA